MALTDGLTNYYLFDGDADDSVGGVDGVVTGATNSSGAGKINEGYNFADFGDFITLGTLEPGDRTGLSISAWVKTSVSGEGFIVDKFASSRSYMLRFSSGNIQFFIGNSAGTGVGATDATDAGGYDDGVYHHVVATWDTSTEIQIYVDGVEDTGGGQTFGSAYNSNSVVAHLGVDDNELGGSIAGDMDEIGFWDRVLTSAEVTELFNGGAGLQYPFTAVPFLPKMMSY